ncbi:MAG: sugar phosphate isomerase/epimerase family protein [Verrucomicrobiota bacterium]
MAIQIGTQTYTWQMSGGKYDGRLDHILRVARQAGFAGVEPETRFLGRLEDPKLLAEALKENDVILPALTLVEDWLNPTETEEERQRADECIQILESFPDTLLNLCQMPTVRENLQERQRNLLSCVNGIARRAADSGIKVGYHPNSPAYSIYRTEEDYKVLLGGLDNRYIGYIPDAGHIAKGGMDPLSIIREYYDAVVHVHYKDMYQDGRWAPLGRGDIDDQEITRFLVERGYEGWIVVEDECDEAVVDPDQIASDDGVYVTENLIPIVNSLEIAK